MSLVDTLRQGGRGVVWYLKQVSGEARWDEYLERCRAQGTEPMSRRQFERLRDHEREHHPARRCC